MDAEASPCTTAARRGRPPEDRRQRQWQIYLAVSSLILERGIRNLSMRDAARTASLSVGALYHYFADKNEMALFGLRTDILAERCRLWHLEHDYLAIADQRAYFDAYVEFSIDGCDFVRPAVLAALDLGTETLRASLDEAITANNTELAAALRPLLQGTPSAEQLASIARQMRRMTFGAVLDRSITRDEIRAALHGLLGSAARVWRTPIATARAQRA